MAELSRKEFTYRGKKIEELKDLETREFAKYLPSKEKKTVLRHFDVIERFLKKCSKKAKENKHIKTHQRDLIIVPRMIGYNIFIHNGKEFSNIKIIPEMIGHRLGEFAITRKRVQHGAAGIGATRSSASRSVK